MICEPSREFWDTFMISPGLYEPWRISDSVRIQLPPWPAVDLWLVLVSYVKSRFRVEVFRVLTLSPIKRPSLVTSLGHSTPLGVGSWRMPFLLFLILLLVHGTVFGKGHFSRWVRVHLIWGHSWIGMSGGDSEQVRIPCPTGFSYPFKRAVLSNSRTQVLHDIPS